MSNRFFYECQKVTTTLCLVLLSCPSQSSGDKRPPGGLEGSSDRALCPRPTQHILWAVPSITQPCLQHRPSVPNPCCHGRETTGTEWTAGKHELQSVLVFGATDVHLNSSSQSCVPNWFWTFAVEVTPVQDLGYNHVWKFVLYERTHYFQSQPAVNQLASSNTHFSFM